MEKELFLSIFGALKQNGNISSPRGLKVIECEDFSYFLTPYNRFCNFKSRKLNIQYIKDEFKWYLKGDAHDLSIVKKAKMWGHLVNENGTINSNYGRYIFASGAFYNVAHILIDDKDSRRASIIILNNVHIQSETKDVPCTYSLNFRIRNNKMNMSVCMRSQDAIFGMGNDAPAFSFIHEMMFIYLKETFKDLEYGNYFHYCNSFHVYEKHFDVLDKIVNGDEFEEVKCPKISSIDEVRFLIKHNFENIPDGFEFAKWLNS